MPRPRDRLVYTHILRKSLQLQAYVCVIVLFSHLDISFRGVDPIIFRTYGNMIADWYQSSAEHVELFISWAQGVKQYNHRLPLVALHHQRLSLVSRPSKEEKTRLPDHTVSVDCLCLELNLIFCFCNFSLPSPINK